MCAFVGRNFVYIHMYINENMNSPGPYVPSAVCCEVIYAFKQGAIHLSYILWAHNRVWGALGTNTCLYTYSDGEQKKKNQIVNNTERANKEDITQTGEMRFNKILPICFFLEKQMHGHVIQVLQVQWVECLF